jgi:hypothetical protein
MSWHIVEMEEPGVVSPQLKPFSPNIFSVCSLFVPNVRIHDAQHPRCKKKPVKMTSTFDLTRCAFFGLGEFFSNPL